MAHYDEHPSRASALRDGKLVVHPDAAASDCTVWFAYEPDRWEGLVGLRVDVDRVRVSGVPFWVYNVNLGDEVRVVESGERALVAESRMQEEANFTFRVAFENAGAEDERWCRLMSDLASLDCWFDIRTPGYLAVSVAAPDAQTVANLLAERAQSGELQYETGRTQYPAPPLSQDR